MGDHAADVGQAGEHRLGCAAHGVQVAKRGSELLGGAFAHVPNAQRKQKAGERRLAAGGNRVQNIVRPFVRARFAVFDGLQLGYI